MAPHELPPKPLTYSLHGVVDGKDLHITGIEDALRAVNSYRDVVGSGKVGALRILYGEEQITVEQLRRLAGKR